MRLYDSLSRRERQVEPSNPDGTIRIYSCGPTVYRYAHIGNFRTFMLGDLVRRALRFEGKDVYWVMNITDVGHMTDEVTDSGRDRMEIARISGTPMHYLMPIGTPPSGEALKTLEALPTPTVKSLPPMAIVP